MTHRKKHDAKEKTPEMCQVKRDVWKIPEREEEKRDDICVNRMSHLYDLLEQKNEGKIPDIYESPYNTSPVRLDERPDHHEQELK